MIRRGLPEGDGSAHPVVVVGAGPAGLIAALELRRLGVAVTVLAGGMDGFDPRYQSLADAEIADPDRHAPMQMAVRRALGGTSLLWGGRFVPFDEIDFAPRPYVPFSGWPIAPAEIAPWYAVAARYFDAGEPVFTAPLPGFPAGGECRVDRLEKWCNLRNLRRLHGAALETDPGLRVHLGAVATGIDLDPETGRITGVSVATPAGDRAMLRPRAVILACGGIETTRLLLVAQRTAPWSFGGAAGPLGRFYMGHHEGRIADIVLSPALPEGAFEFFVDRSGRYARRRITISGEAQLRHGLLNLAAWPENPLLSQAEHRSAILSLAYLSLATPGLGGLLAPAGIRRKYLAHGMADLGGHLRNILRGLPAASGQALAYLYGRYACRPRLPGFFIRNPTGRYSFFYHAEQAPNPASTITLGDERDRLGMPRAVIDLRYGEIDARSVVASHVVIDRELRRTGIGRLEYTVPEEERTDSVLAQAQDGYHQIGTARMSRRAADGIVDPNCRVHGTPNLFIAGSAVFPTSGQANPTLLIGALSARLAEHLAPRLRELPEPATEGDGGRQRRKTSGQAAGARVSPC